MSNLTSLA